MQRHLDRHERLTPLYIYDRLEAPNRIRQAFVALADLEIYYAALTNRLLRAIADSRADIASGHPHPATIVDRFERILED